jgi:ribosomal protein S18 acetylase RimI-like enzyme
VTIELRPLREGEGSQLRDLRLRALQDAPAAFADSFEGGRVLPRRAWAEWARMGAPSTTGMTIVAVDGDAWIGMSVGRLLGDAPDAAWLEALWVDPSVRRAGLGSRLIEAVAAWSRDQGARTLELSVTDNNESAKDLYRRCGFAATGRRRPLPADPSRTEVFLSRPLSA